MSSFTELNNTNNSIFVLLSNAIKEAIEIEKIRPSLNKNEQDRYYLLPIFDKIVEKTKKKNNLENRPRGTEAS